MTMITADAPPARPSRPATVTVAFWLQLGAAALLLCLLGLTVAYAVYYDQQITRAVELVPTADPSDVRIERTSNVVMAAVAGSLFLVGAILFAATVRPLRRGSNVARILVFVAGGGHLLACLLPCFGGFLTIPFFLIADAPEYADPAALPPDELPWEANQFLDTLWSRVAHVEEAFYGVMFLGVALEVLLVVTILILVAVPPANRYFVPRPPTPPWPGGGYPPPVWPGAGYPPPWATPMPTLPYVVCPDPSAHATPPPSAESQPTASPAWPGASYQPPVWPGAGYQPPTWPGAGYPSRWAAPRIPTLPYMLCPDPSAHAAPPPPTDPPKPRPDDQPTPTSP